ncbi:MAG: hypothetical protein JO363_11600, partial [Solirubrobacterales bacterium]|nr:hypothetical protein [Solirubrobacterales bacterium]
MNTPGATATDSGRTHRCAECDTRLAHDQRYCLECGARRGALPSHTAALIGAIHEQGPAASLPEGAPLADSLADMDTRRQRWEFAMPGPRAAAVAVMGMLGFGVIVGSLAGGAPVETLANAPLIVVGLTHPHPSASPAPGITQIVTSVDESGGGAAPVAATPTTTATPPAAQASASPSTSPIAPTGTATAPLTSASGLPSVKHVFMIVLSDRGFARSFGASGGYLSGGLRKQGELVQNYYAVAGAPLANEIALISGQGPTAQTASDCPVFSKIRPGRKGAGGQVLGTGCAYPPATKTLPGQLTAAGHTWKAYVAGLGGGARTACRVPKPGSQQPQLATPHTKYLAWRNPFLYFRSLTARNACRQDEVGLAQFAKDLKSETTTPSLAYIIPPPCATGSEVPCKPGAHASLAGANQFLKSVVPQIKRSAAYKNGGLIAVTFDQAPQAGADADPSACCNSPSYPNLRQLPAGTPAPPPAAMGAGVTAATAPG